MSDHADFLCELGCEELPPKNLPGLANAFAEGVRERLQKLGLDFSDLQSFATPRRLAVLVSGLQLRQPDREMERRGPALKAAFDAEGKPTRAAEGFARSCNTSVDALERLETGQGSWLLARITEQGQPAARLIPNIIAEALAALPVAKRMRWGSASDEFVRPVHWLVALLGDEVLDLELYGVQAGRETRGHRFMGETRFDLPSPADYAAVLEDRGKVIAHFGARRESISNQVQKLAKSLGGQAVIEPELLDEVTALVEWPVAIAGSFEPRFLEVPVEALVYTMSSNQKYFHMVDQRGGLMPHFITVANVESKEPERIQNGNERVIRPRFEDAAFFYQKDLDAGLSSYTEGLEQLVFEKRLGSMGQRCTRLAALCKWLGEQFGISSLEAERAAGLCKCDLLSEMVGEFPDLQGIMGRYYALAAGEPEAVAGAIAEHYQPRGANDALPASTSGQLLALADRLDLLAGIFGIGKEPSGDKDPFALRRAALGIIRILLESGLRLDVTAALEQALKLYPQDLSLPPDSAAQAARFLGQRLHHLAVSEGLEARTVQAVAAVGIGDPVDAMARIKAVARFQQHEGAESLAAANKRVANILSKVEGRISADWSDSLLQDAAEKALAEAVRALGASLEPLLAKGDYDRSLDLLAGLRSPVDQFFDTVLVNHENPELRNNRLGLLSALRGLFMQIADISLLQAG